MPETAPPPDIARMTLAEIARAVAERRLPPVESWHPAHRGDSEMRIARDGTWYHRGAPIPRPAMVRLFAGLLRREADGRHVLVTPVERLDIVVDGTPFLAVEVKSEGVGPDRRLAFRLNTDEAVVAGPEHPLRVEEGQPLLRVRGALDALLARPVYYELAAWALEEGDDPPALWSDGVRFPLASA